MKNAQIYINGVPIQKATGTSLLPRRSLWQKIKDKINFYRGRRKKNCNYNFYFIQDGKPVEIKRSTELKIKLSKKEKEKLRQMRKHRSGSISLEIYDPYKDFKAKIKEQIINKEIKEND